MTSAIILGGHRSGKTVYVSALAEATRTMPVKVWPANAATAKLVKEWNASARPPGTLSTVDMQFAVGRVAHQPWLDRMIDWLFQPPVVDLHLQDTRGGDTEGAVDHGQDALDSIDPWIRAADAILWIIDPASLLDGRKGSVLDQGRLLLQMLRRHPRRGRRLAIVLTKRDFFVADGRLADRLARPGEWVRELLGDFFVALEVRVGAPNIGVFAVSAWGGSSGGSDSQSALPPENRVPSGVAESFAWAIEPSLRRMRRITSGFAAMSRERPARAAIVGSVVGLLLPALLLLLVSNAVSYVGMPAAPSAQASDEELARASLAFDEHLRGFAWAQLLSRGEVVRRKEIVDEEQDRRGLADWQVMNPSRPATTAACLDHLAALVCLQAGCRTDRGRRAAEDVIESLRRQFRERFLEDHLRDVVQLLRGKDRTELERQFGLIQDLLAWVGEEASRRIVDCYVAAADATLSAEAPTSAALTAARLIEHRDWMAATFHRPATAARYGAAKEACGELLQQAITGLLDADELDLEIIEQIAQLVDYQVTLELSSVRIGEILAESVPKHEIADWRRVAWRATDVARFVRVYQRAWELVPVDRRPGQSIVRGAQKMFQGTPARIVVTSLSSPDSYFDPASSILLKFAGKTCAEQQVAEPTVTNGIALFSKPKTLAIPGWKIGDVFHIEVVDSDSLTEKECLITIRVDFRQGATTHTSGQTSIELEIQFDDDDVQRVVDLARQ